MRKRKQAAKDPNKLKRPGGAFFVFMESFRKQYREKHHRNLSVSAAAKAGGEEWKSMSQEDKVPFFLVAKQQMEEYQRQMRAYYKKLVGEEDEGSNKSEYEMNNRESEKQSCGVSEEEEEEEDDDDARLALINRMRKRKQAAKDPIKPNRAASAFFVFMEGFRKQYIEKHPNKLSVSAVGKAGGEEWKSMSEDDKAPFVALAEKRKEDYEKLLLAYNQKSPACCDKSDEEEEASRGFSAFSVFMEGFRKQYIEKHPNKLSVSAVGKAGGEEWKSMSEDDRAPFVVVANQRKEEYERQMRAHYKKLAGEEDEGPNKSEYEMNDEENEKQSCEEEEEEEDDDDDDDAMFAVEMQTEKEKQDGKQDRAPFVAVANQRKEGCEQQIKAHNKKLANEEDEESDMSESKEEEEENNEVEVDSAIIGDLLDKRDEEVDVVRNLLAQQKRKEPTSSSSSLKPKKKTSSTKTIYDWMQRMNTDFRDYLTMERKMLAEKELMLAKKKIKPQEILAELKTSDLDDMQTIKILDLMMRDHILFETFVGLPPEWKYKWLKVQIEK